MSRHVERNGNHLDRDRRRHAAEDVGVLGRVLRPDLVVGNVGEIGRCDVWPGPALFTHDVFEHGFFGRLGPRSYLAGRDRSAGAGIRQLAAVKTTLAPVTAVVQRLRTAPSWWRCSPATWRVMLPIRSAWCVVRELPGSCRGKARTRDADATPGSKGARNTRINPSSAFSGQST